MNVYISLHRHQYSDMLNQVYTSHLHAQLNQAPQQTPQGVVGTHGSQTHGKGSQMFGAQQHTAQAFVSEDYTHLHPFDPLTLHGKNEELFEVIIITR